MHTLQSLADHILYILPCNGQVSIHQADIITLAHTHTAYLYSAHSGSDFCRLDVFRSLSHGFAIRLEVGLEVKSEQRGNALGHSFGFNFERSEEHTSELQSHSDLVCRLLLEKKK